MHLSYIVVLSNDIISSFLNKFIKKEWQKINKDKHNKSNKKYIKNNPYKHATNQAKRRTIKLQRTPKWLTKQDFKTMEMFYEFAAELTKLSSIEYVVDHIVPLQGKNISGLHVPTNLQFLTRKENASKGNRF